MSKRDFHKEVRVVYRACRKKYGIEKTQDECLKVFKVVFPSLYELKRSTDANAAIPQDVRTNLYKIIHEWKPESRLRELINRAEQYIDIPMECDRKELIQFYEDIMPVVMRIRKLTPKECFRLMGVPEPDIDTMLKCGVSHSALYKLAGNSIVSGGNYEDKEGHVDGVLYNIFRKLFIDTDMDIEKGEAVQLSLF